MKSTIPYPVIGSVWVYARKFGPAPLARNNVGHVTGQFLSEKPILVVRIIPTKEFDDELVELFCSGTSKTTFLFRTWLDGVAFKLVS